jgi:hypothetical protein
MFADFGATGKQWRPQDLVRVSSQVAGTDLSGTFQKYIAEANPLPVQECLANAGFDGLILDYGREAHVKPTENSNRLAEEIREHLWGKLSDEHKDCNISHF